MPVHLKNYNFEAKGQRQMDGMEQYRLNAMENRRQEDDIMWQLAREQRDGPSGPHGLTFS